VSDHERRNPVVDVVWKDELGKLFKNSTVTDRERRKPLRSLAQRHMNMNLIQGGLKEVDERIGS
jgi:hypothetical protein